MKKIILKLSKPKFDSLPSHPKKRWSSSNYLPFDGAAVDKNLPPRSRERDEQWINSSLLAFDGILRGNLSKPLQEFANTITYHLSLKINACQAVMFITDRKKNIYRAIANFGGRQDRGTYYFGEGLPGQSILSGEIIYLENLPPGHTLLEISVYKISIQAILSIPLSSHGNIVGSFLFYFFENPSAEAVSFAKQACKSTADMMANISNRRHLERLIMKSKAQKRKLLANEKKLSSYIEELSSANELLDRQAKKIDCAYQVVKDTLGSLMQSIHYAKKIQQVFLAQENALDASFPEHFILYLPKDTVSGDFYWLHESEDSTILAVGDCTGHGVPGAFMSILAMNLLGQAVGEGKLADPKSILDFLKAQVGMHLQKEGQKLNDGFDISVCSISKNRKGGKYEILFAGAKSDLYYTLNGQLHYIKGDRIPIGGGAESNEGQYKSRTLFLGDGETIYFCTDGITDICNQKRRPFGKERLGGLLFSIQEKPLAEQKELIFSRISAYQEGQAQRDDITLLAIKL